MIFIIIIIIIIIIITIIIIIIGVILKINVFFYSLTGKLIKKKKQTTQTPISS